MSLVIIKISRTVFCTLALHYIYTCNTSYTTRSGNGQQL
uniref:Uncharacterized protein n=1 Tax=Setaria italica TaxID=4555 RepID=K3Z1M5_SETIT